MALVVLVAVGALSSACTGEPSVLEPAASAAATAPAVEWDEQADEMSPLVIGAVAPSPIPVLGSDEQFHVAYELTVLNFSPRPAVITSVQTLDPDGTVVATLSQDEVAARTMIVADYSGTPPTGDSEPVGLRIPSGKTALLILDDTYTSREDIPTSVTHQVDAEFGPAESGAGGIAVLWPDAVSQTGGSVTISAKEPVAIGAPLRGEGWLVGNGCCILNGHRNVMLPLDGRINGGERFAIDASQIDVAVTRENGYSAGVEYDGDPADNQSYLAYGEPVLAVADGIVVSVHSTDPDTAPGTLPLGPGFTLANLGGNVIALQLAPDLFAVYYHLAPGSPTVKVGDAVTRGQEIALLGNSGNTSGAHLHFQLSRTPLIFSSESVPYVFDEFTVVGSIDPETGALIEEPAPGPRADALPLALTVIDFR
jgi:hypothetical protein